ncbi:MAG: hypothetical protein PWQ54_1009 [Bacteroidales bacterium]|nr:hypothetical protein [Bacteroidales bacterium]
MIAITVSSGICSILMIDIGQVNQMSRVILLKM